MKIAISEKTTIDLPDGFFVTKEKHRRKAKKELADGVSSVKDKMFFPKPMIKNWDEL